jgi:ArsR family transcriptional regulator, arsenate/arsenite/antimonite-responsive transcriptional repressor / arsenate reductase (thioredoxin)
MVNKETAQFADIFAALGSEPRLEVIRLLLAAYPNGLTVGDIQVSLKIPNSTLSHHLEKLRVERLVEARRDRQFLWYSANVETVKDLLSFLYNGCSLGDNAPHFNANQVSETVKSLKEDGFMFDRFLRSTFESLFGGIFDHLYLPRRFEQFTQKAIHAISLAQNETQRLRHAYVGTEQLLVGLIAEERGMATQVLAAVGVTLEQVKPVIERYIGLGKGTPDEIPFTPRGKKVIRLAVEQSEHFGHHYIGTEHLLLGMILEGEGLGVRVLQDLGIDIRSLENCLKETMGV